MCRWVLLWGGRADAPGGGGHALCGPAPAGEEGGVALVVPGCPEKVRGICGFVPRPRPLCLGAEFPSVCSVMLRNPVQPNKGARRPWWQVGCASGGRRPRFCPAKGGSRQHSHRGREPWLAMAVLRVRCHSGAGAALGSAPLRATCQGPARPWLCASVSLGRSSPQEESLGPEPGAGASGAGWLVTGVASHVSHLVWMQPDDSAEGEPPRGCAPPSEMNLGGREVLLRARVLLCGGLFESQL